MPAGAREPKSSRRTADVAANHAAPGGRAARIAPPRYGIDLVDRFAARQHVPDELDRVLQRVPAATIAPGAGGEASINPLPLALKGRVEALSGVDMSDVRVHTNSALPARIGALAFARGTDIHLGCGQDRHLPHEAWHVVQQKQGRVRANLDLMGVAVNHDAALEREADRIGAHSLATAAAPGATPLAARATTAAPVVQALYGVEVEANIPVYEPQAQWPDLGEGGEGASEVVAFLGGTRANAKDTFLHQGKAGSEKPFSITLDSGGPTKECIQGLLEGWQARASANREELTGLRSHPKKTEYVTEPYSERYMSAVDPAQKPGLFDFFRDFEIMQSQIQTDLQAARAGDRTLTAAGAYGAPALAAWQAAAQYFGLPNHAQEARTAFDAVAASIESQLYVQSTLGVLPEAVARLYAQEQTTAVDRYPLSRGAVDWNEADTVRKEDEAILGAMEAAALGKARELADALQGVNGGDRETFAGYMATILIEVGGEALIEGGRKKAGVLKNVSSLLSKTSLVDYQDQLPSTVRAKIGDAQIRATLAEQGVAWLRAIVLASNAKLDQSGHDRTDIPANAKRLKRIAVPDRGRDLTAQEQDDEPSQDEVAEGVGISYLRLRNRITEILAGTRDRLYDTQLRDQGSGLAAEDPLKGAATGSRDLDAQHKRSKAIPFEVRGPGAANLMQGADLPDYAQAVITRLRAVNDPLDDRSNAREDLNAQGRAVIAAQRRAADRAKGRKVADDYAGQMSLAVVDYDPIGEGNAVALGGMLRNMTIGYRNQLNPAEQADFDHLLDVRYGADYLQYILAKAGQLPFLIMLGETEWLKTQYTTASSAVRAPGPRQPYADAAKELPVARHAAHLSLALEAQAVQYSATLGARGDGIWRTKMLEPFENGNFDAYVRNHVRNIDFGASVQMITAGMQQFELAALARLQKSHGARRKGAQVAEAIEARATQRYHTMGAKKQAFWTAITQHYPGPASIYDRYVAQQAVNLDLQLEQIEAALDTVRQNEIQFIDAIEV